ncbi:MAG: TetR/AcrR family transcriptional regulator [Clostridiales bacterium]|nr:TetR/AcrR family transcriptional regulator [Clostridiales bacterium]
MPKVTQEYLDKKKEMIIDAAYQVCLKKPVEMVTISDVIAETGMSMGAIYRYYDGLDEILADMLKKIRKEYDYYERIEKLSKEKGLSFEEITYRACDIIGEVMEKHLMDIQKINFDFGSLAVNSPERMAKIMEGASGQGITEKIGIFIFPKMVEAAMKQGYKLNGTPEEIGVFISAAFSGIERLCILQANYGSDSYGAKIEPKVLFRTLAKSIILLFGGTVNE